MTAVTLKNGGEEADILVAATMMSLRSLIDEAPIAFYELVMKCRDRNHRLFGNTGQVLQRCSLIQSDESIHNSIRNIVLSAAVGEGLQMSLGSPIKE